MSKKNKQHEGGDLSRSFGQGANDKPPMSKYAKKLAQRRAGMLEEARASGAAQRFQSAAAPAAPALLPSAGTLIPENERRSTTAMVTASYTGAGDKSARFGRVSMPPLDDLSRNKRCFMVADKRDGEWAVTRYAGNLSADGLFEGSKDTIVIGPVTDYGVQRSVFSGMIAWAKEHDPAGMDNTPQKVFGSAQKIYGQRPGRHTPDFRRFNR